jgi:hypothetical protein
MATSAIRKRSWKYWPLNSAPAIRRVSELAPSQAITHCASMVKTPSGVSTATFA